MIGGFGRSFVRSLSTIPSSGLIRLSSKSFIKITGPDSTKFLNGLVTSKLLPTFVKKNQYTITPKDELEAQLLGSQLKLAENDIKELNCGILHEDSYLEDDDLLKIGLRRDGLYSMLLNSKGRVTADIFLHPTPFDIEDLSQEQSFMLELDSSRLSQVYKMFNFHKLGSKVKLEKLENITNWYYYNNSESFDEFLTELKSNYFNNETSNSPQLARGFANALMNDEVVFNKDVNLLSLAIDDRSPNFGLKFTIDDKVPIESVWSSSFLSAFADIEMLEDENIYLKRRLAEGISESVDTPNDSLPFEHNLDFMNGLSYNKGCYTGQELTIRTHVNGVIRKRIMPLQFFLIDADEDSINDSISCNYNSKVSNLLRELDHESVKMEIVKNDSEESNGVEEPVAAAQTSTSPFGESTKPIRRRRQKSNVIGNIIRIEGDIGLSLVNLKHIIDDNSVGNNEFLLKITTEDGVVDRTSEFNVGVKVFVPTWWPEGVFDEIE